MDVFLLPSGWLDEWPRGCVHDLAEKQNWCYIYFTCLRAAKRFKLFLSLFLSQKGFERMITQRANLWKDFEKNLSILVRDIRGWLENTKVEYGIGNTTPTDYILMNQSYYIKANKNSTWQLDHSTQTVVIMRKLLSKLTFKIAFLCFFFSLGVLQKGIKSKWS